MSNIPASSDNAKKLLDAVTTDAVKVELAPGLVCYVTPITAADFDWINGKTDQAFERTIYTLIRKARDVSGEPMFVPGDRAALYELLPTDIVAKLNSALYPTGTFEEAQEKIEDPN